MNEVKELVKERYGKAALGERGYCCAGELVQIAHAIGYSSAELNSVPEGANLGLGCGNPVAVASLREGETVLDLGSGAGFDCFLAAQRVGPTGRVIGVDMTPEMIARARANAEKGGYRNVEFRQGEIEALPVEEASVDVVISNCVLNLVPNKARAFREIYRVLKPGGRMMVSDIVLNRELPALVRRIGTLYTACVGGAIRRDVYLRLLSEAGFEDVEITGETDAVELLLHSPDPMSKALRSLGAARLKGWAVSAQVRARKPADRMSPKQRVLILCTGNSARSQMAEGWLRAMAGERFEVHSAGTHPSQVNPLAIAAMRECGIDISHHRSKSLDEFTLERFDYVITVCDKARESCPVWPGAQAIHWSFEDPAAAEGSEPQRLAVFRRVRDEIRERLQRFVAERQES